MKLTWTQYKSFEDFGKAAAGDLMFNKYQNNIILQNITKQGGKPIDDSVRLVTVSDGGNNLLIGFQTLPWQMLFYFCKDQFNEEALGFYIDKIMENKWNIHQIMAAEEHAKKFAKLYAERTGKKFHNNHNLIVYQLQEICNEPLPKGNCRKAIMEDMNLLPFWGVEFCKETNLDDIGKNLEYQYKNFLEKLDCTYLWEVDGRPSSMTYIDKIENDTIKVSGVYTPPHLRGKGYAFGLVKSICQKYKDKYKNIMLYADADYAPSNKVYLRIGFKPLFINSQFAFEK